VVAKLVAAGRAGVPVDQHHVEVAAAQRAALASGYGLRLRRSYICPSPPGGRRPSAGS
jgi:hypothetical protein